MCLGRSVVARLGFVADAEIRLDHLGVVADLLWRAVREHVALVENKDALRDAHDQPEVVIDDQQPAAEQAPAGVRMTSSSSSDSASLSPAAGSSSNTKYGWVAIARAISTRRWRP